MRPRSADTSEPACTKRDRKSTRLNSSHMSIYTLSLHDALPISLLQLTHLGRERRLVADGARHAPEERRYLGARLHEARSEEHTSELQSHVNLHSFPTRRSSDLAPAADPSRSRASAGSRRRSACARGAPIPRSPPARS